MNNQHKPLSWPRLLLWSHALAIVIFYLILWFRTNPRPVGADVSRPPFADPLSHPPHPEITPPVGADVSRPPFADPLSRPPHPEITSPVGADLSRPPHPEITPPVGADLSRPPLSEPTSPSSHPKTVSPPPIPSLPTISIIVPARDEQDNIRRCVTSLLEQDYDPYEVIVVDDGSTDDTPRILDDIARHHPRGDKLYVLRLRDLPSGWAGKPHALHSGVQRAYGDWLLFTDADTWHAPDALRTAITRATHGKIDLYTLGTQQQLPGFWNKVMMPVAYMGISMQYPIAKVNDPDSPLAIANGQYILIRRAVYDITGGYARPDLRNTLLDDRDLARVVKQNGFRLYMDDGRELVHVYMYTDLRDIWRGWRKNAYLGSRGGLPFVLLELLGLPMVAIVPFLLPFLALLRNPVGACFSTPPLLTANPVGACFSTPRDERSNVASRPTSRELTIASILELTSVLSYRAWLDRNLAVPWYYAFTYPLGAALFTGILAESAWRVLTRKGVEWSGRRYYSG